jgi:hypothetical protein
MPGQSSEEQLSYLKSPFCKVRYAEKNYSTMVSHLWEEQVLQIKSFACYLNTSTTQYQLQRNIPKHNEQLH